VSGRVPLRRFGADPESERRLWTSPRATTLVDLLDSADLAPEVTAFRFVDHAPSAEDISWRQLRANAQGAAGLLAASGVTRGDRVVIMLPTRPSFCAMFFGALWLGAIPVPVVPPQTLRADKRDLLFDTITRIARDCDARVVAGLDRTLSLLSEYVARSGGSMAMVSADQLTPQDAPPEVVTACQDDLALLQYTSGSTSDPKGVELTHRSIIANVAAIAGAITNRDSVGVNWLPLHHDMGLIGGALTALYCRRPQLHMPPQSFAKNPARWLQYLSDVRATITVAPNFAYGFCIEHIADDDLAGVDLSALEVALNGAEPIDPATIAAFEGRFARWGLRPGVVRPVYGLAESSLAVSFGEPGPPQLDEVDAAALEQRGVATIAERDRRRRTFVSVGAPLATQQVRIVDADDQTLPDRVIGEIVVRGPSVMRGYYGQPALSAAALRGGWLHTGDLGYIAAGQLYVTGRSKDLIIRLGKNYHAQDIERAVMRLAGVHQGGVAALGIDEDAVIKIVVIAETRVRDAQARTDLATAIRDACRTQFDLGPDEIHLVAPGSIPRTTSGKVRRPECRALRASVPGAPI
jgi:acyl-CoA synthetase (AMP-forming)/AMP-acid ligase II